MKNLLITLLLLCGTAFAQEDKLISVLNSDAPRKEKADACRELARLGTTKAVPALAPLLLNPELSDMARYALEPIRGRAVDAALRDALGKVQGPMLVGMMSSLAVRKDAKAVAPIANLLTHTDRAVAQAAARSLGSIGGRASVKALERALPTTSKANQPAVIEGLLRCAEGTSGARAAAIYDQLRTLPGQPVQVRAAALRGAILSRGAKGRTLLVEALRTESYLPAADVLRISLQMPGAAVTKAIAGELAGASPQKQAVIVEALGWRNDPSAAPALAPLARRGPPGLRSLAIRSLVQLGNPSSVPLLVALLKDPDPGAVSAAQTGLTGFAGKAAETALVTLLTDPAPKIRAFAIQSIGQRRISTAVPALVNATRDTDPAVVKSSFESLGALGGVREIPGILDAMSTSSSVASAETAVAEICARQPDPTVCADKLLQRLNRVSGEPKLALVRLLRAAGGPRALAAVRAIAAGPDAAAKEAALRVLCDWPSPEVLPDLAQISKSSADKTMKVLAVRGQLRLVGLDSVPEAQKLSLLKQMLPSIDRQEEQRLALAALGAIPSAAALALVTPYLGQEGLKEEAGVAAVAIAEKIVTTNPAEVAQALQELQVSDKKLSGRARALLGRIPPESIHPGFIPIFNGKNLAGWSGAPGWWTVEDGALTAESTPEKPCKKCNYLVWRGGQPSDFELLADFKLSRSANSGIQLRSEERPDFDTFGYQADMTGDGQLVGFLYHHARGLIAGRGEKVVFAADGKKTAEPLCNAAEALQHFKPEDWNSYRVICRGPEIMIYLNGILVCQVTDHHATQAASKGIIALQMHPGPPMKVQFQNLLLKELK